MEIIKKHLKFNQKDESCNYYHFLFHTSVQQYTQSRIHRPNKFFIYLPFHFLLDPCGFGSATQKIRNEKILHILTNILLKTTRYFNSKSYGVSFKSRAKAKFKGIHPKTSALGGPTPSVSDPDPHESPLWATSWIRIQEVNKASS